MPSRVPLFADIILYKGGARLTPHQLESLTRCRTCKHCENKRPLVISGITTTGNSGVRSLSALCYSKPLSRRRNMGEVLPEDAPFPLTEVDKWILSQTDEEFHKHDWEELRGIIETNNLSVLKRKPSDLRRYMKWTAETKAEYGSMTQYLLVHRLPKAWGQPPFTPASTVPFEDPSDYRVLLNDWPYGLDPEITHIVVWLRTPIATEPETGDMTPESRERVRGFVKRCFIDALGPGGEDRVLWFKNWVALQSVRSLEHIHVLVRSVDDETLERWTGEKPKPSD